MKPTNPVQEVYGEQVRIGGAWFHAERVLGRPAREFKVGQDVSDFFAKAAPRAVVVDDAAETIQSSFFRESGANITDESKIEGFYGAMLAYGGWGSFPPASGYVHELTQEEFDRHEELAQQGVAHELAFSRPLQQSDVGARYVQLAEGHHRSYAASRLGCEIRVVDLAKQEEGEGYMGYSCSNVERAR